MPSLRPIFGLRRGADRGYLRPGSTRHAPSGVRNPGLIGSLPLTSARAAFLASAGTTHATTGNAGTIASCSHAKTTLNVCGVHAVFTAERFEPAPRSEPAAEKAPSLSLAFPRHSARSENHGMSLLSSPSLIPYPAAADGDLLSAIRAGCAWTEDLDKPVISQSGARFAPAAKSTNSLEGCFRHCTAGYSS